MSEVASTRFGSGEKRLVERASRRLGISRAEFLRRAALDAAEGLLSRREYTRAELIDRIAANRRCPWTPQELQSKSLEDLKKIDRLLHPLDLHEDG